MKLSAYPNITISTHNLSAYLYCKSRSCFKLNFMQKEALGGGEKGAAAAAQSANKKKDDKTGTG